MNHPRRGGWLTPALLGAVIGPALQLQQPALWEWRAYAWLVAWDWLAGLSPRWPCAPAGATAGVRTGVILLAAALLAFGLTGLRAVTFPVARPRPGAGGPRPVVTGVVAAMPQRNETGRALPAGCRVGHRGRRAGARPCRRSTWAGTAAPWPRPAAASNCSASRPTCAPASAGSMTRAPEGAARQQQSARLRLRAVAVGAGPAGHRLRARRAARSAAAAPRPTPGAIRWSGRAKRCAMRSSSRWPIARRPACWRRWSSATRTRSSAATGTSSAPPAWPT